MSRSQNYRGASSANLIHCGGGAKAITLGTILPAPSTAIHCNEEGTAICHFEDGSSATLFFAKGGLYDYRLTLVATAGGTDPTLIAIF